MSLCLNVPGSARVAIVTTNVGIHGLSVVMETNTCMSSSGNTENLRIQSALKGLGGDCDQQGFHIIMNQLMAAVSLTVATVMEKDAGDWC